MRMHLGSPAIVPRVDGGVKMKFQFNSKAHAFSVNPYFLYSCVPSPGQLRQAVQQSPFREPRPPGLKLEEILTLTSEPEWLRMWGRVQNENAGPFVKKQCLSISRQWQQGMKPSGRPSRRGAFEHGALCDCMGSMPMKPVLPLTLTQE